MNTAPPQRWRLVRNCSLTPRQTLLAFSVPVAVLTAVGALFVLIGYPVVAIFCALEIVGVVVALVLYARHARDGDTLVLADGQLQVERQLGGRVVSTTLTASQVRLSPCPKGQPIELRAGTARITVGDAVPPPQRDRTALDLRRALQLDSCCGQTAAMAHRAARDIGRRAEAGPDTPQIHP